MDSKLDELFFTVDGESFDAFTALLDEAPAPDAGLERLLAVKPPWAAHSEEARLDN
jgi:uncharacterized protein (DUF1778 family)